MTTIRNELSKKNKYYIGKHRYLELKHFCLQYPEWKREYYALDRFIRSVTTRNIVDGSPTDHTGDLAAKRADLASKCTLIENTAQIASEELSDYILKAVTEDVSFTKLKTLYDIPCERDMYYDRYRRFFWLLSASR